MATAFNRCHCGDVIKLPENTICFLSLFPSFLIYMDIISSYESALESMLLSWSNCESRCNDMASPRKI